MTDFKAGDYVRIKVDHNNDERGWVIGKFVTYVDMDPADVRAAWGSATTELKHLALIQFDPPAVVRSSGGTLVTDVVLEDLENIEPAKWYVRVYRVDQAYGGPEEGGWWFTTGDAVGASVEVEDRETAEAVREELRKDYPDTGKSYSVLGGDDYAIHIDTEPLPDSFPESRPHYE